MSTGAAVCPEHLDDEAKRCWRHVAEILERVGLLTDMDEGALASYCQAWSTWVKAWRHVQDEGLVINPFTRDKKGRFRSVGYPIQNPYLAIANTANDQMKKYMVELGLTPAARTRLAINEIPQPRTNAPKKSGTESAEDEFFGPTRPGPDVLQ